MSDLEPIIKIVEDMRRQWEDHHDKDLDALAARLRAAIPALEALRKVITENEAARAYIGDAGWKQYVETARSQFVPTPNRENEVHYPTGKNTRIDR